MCAGATASWATRASAAASWAMCASDVTNWTTCASAAASWATCASEVTNWTTCASETDELNFLKLTKLNFLKV